MVKFDYDEIAKLKMSLQHSKVNVVSKFNSFNSSIDTFQGTGESLKGVSWDSARTYFNAYKEVSSSLYNALYEIDDELSFYVQSFEVEVGTAENKLDTDKLEELKDRLRQQQLEKSEIMEALSAAFGDIPIIGKYFKEESMNGTAEKIMILEKFKAFNNTHDSDFSEYSSVINAVKEGISYLGNSKNFEGGKTGYSVAELETSEWYKTIKEFNKDQPKDRYEIIGYPTDNAGGMDYYVLKNGVVDTEKTLEMTQESLKELYSIGIEGFKILSGLDDVEVICDDGSTTGQKATASIWLLLSVLPADKVKDLIKVARLAKKGEKGKTIFRVSAESLEAIKKAEKARDVTKTIDSIHDIDKLKDTEKFTDKGVKHVLDGDVNKSGKATGYHSEALKDSKGKIVDGTKSTPNEYGVYEAKVEVDGISKGAKSTFFPDEWDAQKIVDEIDNAYNNRKFVENTSNTYIGTASNGMKIQMFLDKSGKIISAFPKYS